MTPEKNPVELAAAIYAERRQYPVAAIQKTDQPVMFDAGCGYGSESFLFAALGAQVIAADMDPQKIRIARLRQPYYEELFQKKLDIDFQVADLDTHVPASRNISLTWLASVLAAIPNQDRLVQSIFDATRPGGQVMISDMNMWNPLFLFGEWRRREIAKRETPKFAENADFGAMFHRRNRIGARYWTVGGRILFDDVQFFSPATLNGLLNQVGFRSTKFYFSGFVPPFLARFGLTRFESVVARLPLISQFGYFYLCIGFK